MRIGWRDNRVQSRAAPKAAATEDADTEGAFMTWFRENPFLGRFVIVFGVCLLGATWFFFSVKSDFEEVSAYFGSTASELNRLERLAPYPNGDNLRQKKKHAEDYASAP